MQVITKVLLFPPSASEIGSMKVYYSKFFQFWQVLSKREYNIAIFSMKWELSIKERVYLCGNQTETITKFNLYCCISLFGIVYLEKS